MTNQPVNRSTAPRTVDFKEVTDATFERDVINQEGLVYVFFHSAQCDFCKDMKVTLDNVAIAFKDYMQFVKVDTMANPIFAARYGMKGAPYSVILRKGEILNELPTAKITPGFKSTWEGTAANVQYFINWLNSVINRANFK